ncbi:MAG: hypothetical protein ACTSX8_07730 [Alphaproteobacteria bacterium]
MQNEQPGIRVQAIKVSDSEFIAVMPFSYLQSVTVDPRLLSQPPVSETSEDYDADLEFMKAVYNVIQRPVALSKKSNVVPYSDFIRTIIEGAKAPIPAIKLTCAESISFPDDNDGFAVIPPNVRFVAIDGDTQLAAHYRFQRAEKRKEMRDRHKGFPIKCVIMHGLTDQEREQAFAIANRAIAVPKSMAVERDMQNPLVMAARELCDMDVLQHPVTRRSVVARGMQKVSARKGLVYDVPLLVSALDMICNDHSIKVARKSGPVQNKKRMATPLEKVKIGSVCLCNVLPFLQDVGAFGVANHAHAFSARTVHLALIRVMADAHSGALTIDDRTVSLVELAQCMTLRDTNPSSASSWKDLVPGWGSNDIKIGELANLIVRGHHKINKTNRVMQAVQASAQAPAQ